MIYDLKHCSKIKISIVWLAGVIIIAGCSAKKAEYPNRAYFEINSLYTTIDIPIRINDTVAVKMIFDSGCSRGTFDLDSTFCAAHPLHLWQQEPSFISQTGGSAWVNKRLESEAFIYEKDFIVTIGKTSLDYKRLSVWNRVRYWGDTGTDGIFSLPKDDMSHIWELNFENNYIEIHHADTFLMPDDCLTVPIHFESGRWMKATIPMKITTDDEDALTINQDFLVDTGMSWDVAIAGQVEELPFFEGKKAMPFHYGGGGYVNRHIVDAEILDGFHVDSLRIYTLKESFNLPTNYLIGLNFLKRFNVFFDIKNGRMGLQPLKEFRRTFSPIWKRFSIDIYKTERGSYLVTELADHEFNHYKKAGIKTGDEIIAINGVALAPDVPESEDAKLLNNFRVVFDILRDGEQLTITMERDPNEIHGD